MAYKCKICGKSPVTGNSYSHSHKATKRIFKPNLQKQKIILNGAVQSALICTNCIKSGKAHRPLKAV
ncbi:MAG: 50S ribosomal protein L28 [Elusimicrobia bacterium RIFOXYA12_FULL_51_18]|nr:MAG: 50S ribosomal protein L28 [Elusimicrobia bacterium RIFOXYA12_FULL_51_18]OGS30251.1 MAG: 50S ribosomal protein L28 [Elusimicrobia bacterium RIFOXYA2_FULL_53_38]